MSHAEDLAKRYIQIWNEADPAARRAEVAALWIENGTHYVREREVNGHAALETRVATSHQTNVAERNYRFEPNGRRRAALRPGQVQLAHGAERWRRGRRDRTDRLPAGRRWPDTN